MKLLPQVLVTLALVWGSLFVHDRFCTNDTEPSKTTPPVETADTPDEPAPPTEPTPEPVIEDEDTDEDADEDGEPTEAELERFIVVLEAAENLRRERRTADRIRSQVERLDMDLSDQQTTALIAMTAQYQDSIRRKWAELPRGGDAESREARRQVFADMQADFVEVLEMVLTPEQAEKAGAGLARGSGFGAGRGPR